MERWQIIFVYLALVNAVGFALMGIDKWKARHHKWRIREATLFLAALLGGSLGSVLGMHVFRHKTKHWYFKYGMPLILAAQAALGLWLRFGRGAV